MDATGRRLVLVRHGQAVHDDAVDDHERPLTARGRRDAVALGRWLDDVVGALEVVLCSSSARTVQTWGLAAGVLADAPGADVRDELYLGSPGTLLAAVRSTPPDAGTVVVVGHEPVQSTLAAALAGPGSSPQALTALAAGFSPGAVAVLAVAGEWADLAPDCARLVAIAVPRG